MGQDKALLPFLGTPLIARVISRVAALGEELFITTNNPQKYLDFNVPLFEDVLPGMGALGGLYTALSVASFPVVIVVACDMPFVNADILSDAVAQLNSSRADAVVPRTEKGFEPFHAVYRMETCLPAVQKALLAGERRLISWFPAVKVTPIPESELLKFDPQQVAFKNLNTREDLRLAEALARTIDR